MYLFIFSIYPEIINAELKKYKHLIVSYFSSVMNSLFNILDEVYSKFRLIDWFTRCGTWDVHRNQEHVNIEHEVRR